MLLKRLLQLAVGAATLTLALGTVSAQDKPYRVVAYFQSWNIYDRGYFVTDIPGDKITHINYAFANVSADGEILLGDEWADTQFPYPDDADDQPLLGNFNQLNLLKEAYPNVTTSISVGGWTWSDKFSDVALTAESRAKFAASCVAFIKQYGFDGVDIDWEYPTGDGLETNIVRPEDPENFVLLLAELRTQLDAQEAIDGHHYLLTIAAPTGEQYQDMHLDEIMASLDWVNLMAYDFSGPWTDVTGFNAPLYGASSADYYVKGYLNAGVPSDKLVLGVPFYGRGWEGVADTNNGLDQPYASIPNGTFGEGVFEYFDVAANWSNTMTRYWDDEAGVPWLYNAETGLMISYDDAESMKLKADYIKSQNLGGAMIWEVGGDDPNSTLLTALDSTLNGGSVESP